MTPTVKCTTSDGYTWNVSPVLPGAVEAIPGLHWHKDGKARGPRDAVAILLQRLSVTNPGTDRTQTVAALLGPNIDTTLRDYQRTGVSKLAGMLQLDGGAVLADDMGLGKTVQTLATWEALGCPSPLLVVAPASVRRTWAREIAKWCPTVQATLVDTGTKAAKLTKESKVVITSYELATKLSDRFTPAMMVLDEAHLLRGRGAKRSLGLHELAQAVRYKLALTGTPIWSRPRDWWMLLKVLFNYRFGNADEFDRAYCGLTYNKWGGKENEGVSRPTELKERIRHVMLRRTKEEVATELPAMTRTVRWVPATKEAKLAAEAAVLGTLSVYDALAATLAAKIEPTVEAMREAGQSLVFTWRKADAYAIAEGAEELGLKVEVITGDQSHAERQRCVDRARTSGASVVATIDSTGTGVDGLQHVATVGIFHALDYVPIKLAQAEARLHRIGVANPVQWIYIAMERSADAGIISTVVEKLDQYRLLMGADSTSDIGSTLNVTVSEEAALKAVMEAMRYE